MRRRGGPAVDGIAELGEEALQAGRRGGAEQPRLRVGRVAEGVRRVGRDVHGLTGREAHRRVVTERDLDGALQDAEALLEVVPVRRGAAPARGLPVASLGATPGAPAAA